MKMKHHVVEILFNAKKVNKINCMKSAFCVATAGNDY
jgi:hypothetical protein